MFVCMYLISQSYWAIYAADDLGKQYLQLQFNGASMVKVTSWLHHCLDQLPLQ